MKPVVTPEVAGVATEVPAAAEAVTEAAAQPAAADEAEEGWTAAEMASAISSLFAGVLRPQAAQSVGAQLELLSSAQLSSARASPATLPAAQLSAPPSLPCPRSLPSLLPLAGSSRTAICRAPTMPTEPCPPAARPARCDAAWRAAAVARGEPLCRARVPLCGSSVERWLPAERERCAHPHAAASAWGRARAHAQWPDVYTFARAARAESRHDQGLSSGWYPRNLSLPSHACVNTVRVRLPRVASSERVGVCLAERALKRVTSNE